MDLLNYICGHLLSSEKAINVLLSRQGKIENKLKTLAIATTIYAIFLNIEHNNQNNKIKQLEKSIEELRHKGE